MRQCLSLQRKFAFASAASIYSERSMLDCATLFAGRAGSVNLRVKNGSPRLRPGVPPVAASTPATVCTSRGINVIRKCPNVAR